MQPLLGRAPPAELILICTPTSAPLLGEAAAVAPTRAPAPVSTAPTTAAADIDAVLRDPDFIRSLLNESPDAPPAVKDSSPGESAPAAAAAVDSVPTAQGSGKWFSARLVLEDHFRKEWILDVDKPLVEFMRFDCQKCKLLAPDNVTTSCGHTFCTTCWRCGRSTMPILADCPSCHAPNVTLIKNPMLQKSIGNVRVLCVGCSWRGERAGWLVHVRSKCPRALVACRWCGNEWERAALAEHETKTCERREVPCSGCSARPLACQLQEHLTTSCEGRLVECETKCGATFRHGDLKQHQQTCPERVISCPTSTSMSTSASGSCDFKCKRLEMTDHLLDRQYALTHLTHCLQRLDETEKTLAKTLQRTEELETSMKLLVRGTAFPTVGATGTAGTAATSGPAGPEAAGTVTPGQMLTVERTEAEHKQLLRGLGSVLTELNDRVLQGLPGAVADRELFNLFTQRARVICLAADSQGLWDPATVVNISPGPEGRQYDCKCVVHFVNFETRYDETISLSSGRLRKFTPEPSAMVAGWPADAIMTMAWWTRWVDTLRVGDRVDLFVRGRRALSRAAGPPLASWVPGMVKHVDAQSVRVEYASELSSETQRLETTLHKPGDVTLLSPFQCVTSLRPLPPLPPLPSLPSLPPLASSRGGDDTDDEMPDLTGVSDDDDEDLPPLVSTEPVAAPAPRGGQGAASAAVAENS